MTGQVADGKRMRLRYAGTCRECGIELASGTEAIYERATRTVRCLSHVIAEPEPGVAGASARREYERRKAKREDRIRGAHPRLGGLILALSDDPQSTRAWDTGAIGEERLGRRLDELASERLRVLHDRRIPRSKANIDHLAVTPTGVWVVDAKRYRDQRPRLRVEGGMFRPRVEKLVIASRDRSKLLEGMLEQVAVVRGVVGPDIPVRGALCFIEADWPLIGAAFAARGVEVLWPRKLQRTLQAGGPLTVEAIAETHCRLASDLPPS